jgi:hypothetical protein
VNTFLLHVEADWDTDIDVSLAAVEAISLARNAPDRETNNITDIQSLENGLVELLDMLNRVSGYVGGVLVSQAIF